MKLFCSLIRNDGGATSIEYGLIAALIALAIITGATTIGTDLGTTFNNIASSI
jgi:pilus assembly protein Flp/PilA